MNKLKKGYCRIFQMAFKLAIPILPYRNPQILNSVSEIPEVLKDKNINSVLVVTDKSVRSLGLTKIFEEAMEQSRIKFVFYDKVVPNPTVSNVEEAKEYYIKNNCQAIVGFGGGSSIDCAKAIGARIARPKKSINKMEGILRIMHRTPFMIAVPTTAGTGSEVTLATVITDDSNGHKFPISDFSLIPNVAVLDAKITKTLPPLITSTTGMDALTHAVEAYIGRSTVKSTRKDALKAVELIGKNLETAYSDGENLSAREAMLKAAFLAGRAFSKSYVGYCHAVAHSLGGEYKIAHGLANAVILPYCLERYGSTIYKKGKDLAIALGVAAEESSAEAATKALIEAIRKMNERMGIADKLSGIKKADIEKLSKYADKEANPLYPVPKLMGAKELEKIYYDVMEEEV